VIERASGILMERHGVTSSASFAMLRDHARGRNDRLVDVATAVVDGHGLLPAFGAPGSRPDVPDRT
jgi:response regulator NasT